MSFKCVVVMIGSLTSQFFGLSVIRIRVNFELRLRFELRVISPVDGERISKIYAVQPHASACPSGQLSALRFAAINHGQDCFHSFHFVFHTLRFSGFFVM